MSNPVTTRRRRRFAPLVAVAGLLAAGAMGFSLTPAFSGFTAGISNNANSVGTGTLLMSETQGATTCLSSATGTVTSTNSQNCAINKFNGTTTALPGVSYTSTVTIKNNGTVTANAFTLTPLGCSSAANGTNNGTNTGICSKVNVTISDDTDTKCVFPASTSACAAPTSTNTLSSLGTSALNLTTQTGTIAPGASKTFTFTVQLDNSATNDYQGLAANETLNWAFGS